MSTPLVVTHPCALVRDGLHQIFTKSQFRPIQIIPALTEEAESYLASAGICIWLVGVQQPGRAINETIRRVVTANPHARVVLLAASYAPEDVVPALESGAGGFLCQDIPSNQLIKSLELIVLGQTVTHPQFHQIAAMTPASSGRPKPSARAISGIAVAAGYRADEPQALRPEEPRPPYLVQSAPAASQPRPASEPCRRSRHRAVAPRDGNLADAYRRRLEQDHRPQAGDHGVDREGSHEGHSAQAEATEPHPGRDLGANASW